MLRLLLQIYFEGIRRNRNKAATAVNLCSIFFLAICISVLFSVFEEERQHFATAFDWFSIVPYLAVAMMIPDFIMKLVMKRDASVMDDWLKSRPVDNRSWNRFLVLRNVFDMWNWYLPLCMTLMCGVVMGIADAALSAVFFLAVSMVNGVAITVFRKGQGWEYKTPIFLFGVFWVTVMGIYTFNLFHLASAAHIIGFVLMCLVAIYGLYIYSCTLHSYTDYSQHTSKTHNYSASLNTMIFWGTFRSKQFCASLFYPLFIVINLFNLESEAIGSYFAELLVLMFITLTSVFLGKNVLSIEANFMDGLWTRPCSLKTILRKNYKFHAIVNAIYAAIACAILHDSVKTPPYYILSALMYVIGVQNMICYIVIFYTKRIDLFTLSFYTPHQSNNFLTTLMLLAPIVLAALILFIFPVETSSIILAAMGAIGILLHPIVINRFAKKYTENRYEHFERYRN